MNKASFIPALALATLSLASCQNNNDRPYASGNFEATEVIVSSEGTGKLLSFKLEEGQHLTTGQSVGSIDTIQLYLKKLQLRSSGQSLQHKKSDVPVQIASLKEQLVKLHTERTRFAQLFAQKAATSKQVEDLDSQIKVVQKQLAAQVSTLERSNQSVSEESSAVDIQVAQIDDQLKKCRLTSPKQGTVLVKYVQAGELMTVGKPLFKIANVQTLFLRAYLTSDQLSQVKLGQTVKVVTDWGKDEQHETKGIVTWISDKAEFTPKSIQTRNERANLVYAIKVAVPNNSGYLKIGMYGEIAL